MQPVSRVALPRPVLMLITDSKRGARSFPGQNWITEIVAQAVAGGANAVQLREKHLGRTALVEIGLDVREVLARRALFFVNGDVDAAIALRASGIHLQEGRPSVADVRARVGDAVLISRAVHSVEDAVLAEREGADVVQLGTIFETASKPGVKPLGLEGVRAAAEAMSIPLIAVGGITAGNAAGVVRAGAAGVAVIGAIFDAHDPRAAAEELYSAIATAARGHDNSAGPVDP